MTLTLPANLDLDAHLAKFPPVVITNFQKDFLVYFLSLLHSIPANNKRIVEDLDGWVPFYSPLLADKTKNYLQYLNYALGKVDPDQPETANQEAVIIITDNRYITGVKTKYYRFSDTYNDADQVQTAEITNFILKKKLVKEARKRNAKASESYPNLTKWFNSKLQIDGEKAREFIKAYREANEEQTTMDRFNLFMQKMNSPLQSDHFDAKYGTISAEKPRLQYTTSLYNIGRLEDLNFHLSVDENIQRFHSNLTNLKSELRNFLTYDGQPLVSIDIKNSQPFLSLALFNKEFYVINSENESEGVRAGLKRTTDRFTIDTVAPEIAKEFLETKVKIPLPEPIRQGRKTIKTTSGNIVSSLIMFTESGDNATQSLSQLDFVQFSKAVISGRFYEEFEASVKERLGKEFTNRAETKKAVFLVLFTDNQFWGQEDAAPKRVFAEVYPTVYELFRRVKAVDSTALPRLLQSIESWLILDKICARISREQPNLPIFTIHDSILTIKGEENYVKEVMQDEIQKYIGHTPALEVTFYDPDKALQENS